MPNAADILWFKTTFQVRVRAGIAGTPLTLDFIAALACQETGEIWPVLRTKGWSEQRILALCVGDTYDESSKPPRKKFPLSKSDLLGQPNGQQMFDIARKALEELAKQVPGYGSAVKKPSKICHGFGMFQLDLQYFEASHRKQSYFLKRDYETFSASFRECMAELRSALRRQGYSNRTALTDEELAEIGIVYNTGTYNRKLGLRQGHKDGNGKFYGELLFDYIRLAHTVAVSPEVVEVAPPAPGQAILPPQPSARSAGTRHVVETPGRTLRLRSEPKRSRPVEGNVVAELPQGQPVSVSRSGRSGFRKIETELGGAVFTGFVAKEFLSANSPQALPAWTGPSIPQAHLSPRPGLVISRREKLDAYSLNEAGQPGRIADTAAGLRAELLAIIQWLAVDRASHLRYKKDRYTYCNIYCHDYCHLAGVYIPRVWWTQRALAAIASGQQVKPEYERTVEELRVNDLFRWLTDFGAAFSWRRASFLDELQTSANQGAVALILARNRSEGVSGHVAMVVPESDAKAAIRAPSGEVLSPVQSQAGSTNFQLGTGVRNWWKGERFADSAFWVHA